MTVGLIYICLFTAGLVYALIAGFFGWLGDIGGGADIHMDLSGHLAPGHTHPVAGPVLATFVTGFGGGGILAQFVLGWSIFPGLGLATLLGGGMALAALLTLEFVLKQTVAGSEFSMSEAEGGEGEVIASLPAGGTGEVAYDMRGQREVAPARSAEGTAIAKGTIVVIDKVVGNTLYVRDKRAKQ